MDVSNDDDNASQNGSALLGTVHGKICELQEGTDEQISFSGSFCDQKLQVENSCVDDSISKKQSGIFTNAITLILVSFFKTDIII